jgi:ParB-like chromosome segregation protein Spo0J
MKILSQREQFPWRIAMPWGPVHQVPVETIDRYRQVRNGKPYAPSPPQSLIDDIGANGVTNPLRLLSDGNKAVLDDGHHRLEVARGLGLTHLPIMVNQVAPVVMREIEMDKKRVTHSVGEDIAGLAPSRWRDS